MHEPSFRRASEPRTASTHAWGAVCRLFAAVVRPAIALVSRIECAACGAPIHERAAFCAPCGDAVLREPRGGRPLTDFTRSRDMNGGGTSGRVGAHPHLRVHAYGAYGGPLADAIVRFKYSARGDLALPLGRLLRDLAVDSGLVADAVVPVPLHPTRLVVRGFNQAALLAKPVAVALDAALVTGALTRRRPARTQAWLTAAEREHNVHATFAVRDPHMFAGRRILLIDDVTTTGATLRACGAALYQARARSVAALVLARTE